MAIGWIGAALILGIAEIFSVDMFFLALGISALAAGVSALAGASIGVQILVFFLSSVLCLFLVRPWAKRKLARTTPGIETNARGLIGKTALITAPLLGPAGRVRLEGAEWSARGVEGAFFPVGTEVRVVAIEGAVAVVGPLDLVVDRPADSEPPRQ